MCSCRRGLTICAVCFGLLSAPVGATNPPAAAVGHILNAGSSVASVSFQTFSTPNTVTGSVHRLPLEVRVAMYERDKPVESLQPFWGWLYRTGT
jgi:hypothetical protein